MACETAGANAGLRRALRFGAVGGTAAMAASALTSSSQAAFVVSGGQPVLGARPVAAVAAPPSVQGVQPSAAALEHATGVTFRAAAFGAVAAGALRTVAEVSRQRRAGRQGRGLRVATVDPPATTKVENREDLTDALPDCPATIWKADDIDIANLPEVEETSPLLIDAAELGEALKNGETAYFTEQREKILEQLQKHGAIWFRNFKTMKDAEGFRTFYELLQLNPCLDPIHTSGLREMVGKKDAVYEAVNKPSLAQHFVGLHNESTFVKTAMFGAFVCFKPATEGGGEFILADGANIINDMDLDVLKRIYERKVRISVSNLDLNFIGALPEDWQDGTKDYFQDLILKVVAPKFDMDLEMVYGADKTNPYRLQAIEHAQSPINTHPVTGQPVWFCNVHNHSRYLRDRRPCTVPEVGMTDVYHGDLGKISPEDVRHINEVCERNIVDLMMKEGDVVLLDNYRVLHGRRTFKGDRNHAVTWFDSCGERKQQVDKGDRPDDFMNNLINKTLV